MALTGRSALVSAARRTFPGNGPSALVRQGRMVLAGLRAWPLTRYPHLVFYVERPDHIDVWRVLNGQRDIPAWMQEPDAV